MSSSGTLHAKPEAGAAGCCGPARPAGRKPAAERAPAKRRVEAGPRPHPEPRLIALEGSTFLMGSDDDDGHAEDGEGPVREVELSAFGIEPVAVTNRRFAEFVDATGYVTDGERHGWSFVFGGLLPDEFPDTRGVAGAPWWREVHGASWRHPEGTQSSIDERMEHPVVQVSWNDATAFCDWAGLRLPTEAEWEYAARGGLVCKRFPWGDELEPGGEHAMNVWQGTFPMENTLGDGHYGTCPVDEFPPNAYGLHNTTGNVWEWCADWFDASAQARVIRGGSHLCHESYCNRYRVAARNSNTSDSSLGHMGFRCAGDPPGAATDLNSDHDTAARPDADAGETQRRNT